MSEFWTTALQFSLHGLQPEELKQNRVSVKVTFSKAKKYQKKTQVCGDIAYYVGEGMFQKGIGNRWNIL